MISRNRPYPVRSGRSFYERLEDLLERGGIRRDVPSTEADHRERLAGRLNRPVNELSARLLLKRAEELRGERQRRAGTGGDAEKLSTINHALGQVGLR
jgi:hypothetical protein